MDRGKIEHVKVYLRIRPLKAGETLNKKENAMEVDGKYNIILNKNRNGDADKIFKFERVFTEKSTQKEIYELVASPIVNSVLLGVNGTIFAYGQTGTGKTFTMAGNDVNDVSGIIPSSFYHIFEKILNSSQQTSFVVTVTYLEIYNENIRDLLSFNVNQRLQIHENKKLGTFVKNLSGFTVNSIMEINTLFQRGQKNRTTKFTNMNNTSSRSHAIFTIIIESKDNETDEIVVGKLNFVDLAGSERLDRSQVTDDRLKEAGHINLSLSVLGNVISSLLDKKSAYFPYRNSKLTRLLQDSLGGNSKTAMIATLSPADVDYNESICTLRYASRVGNIKNFVTTNKKENGLIEAFESEIRCLKKQIQFLETTEASKNIKQKKLSQKSEAKQKLEEEISSIENERKVISEKIDLLQNKIIIGGENYLKKAEEQTISLKSTFSELEVLDNKTIELEKTLLKKSQESSDLKATYSSLQEENEDLDRQIIEIQKLLRASKYELAQQQSEEQFELERLREDARVLKKDNGLASLVVYNFVPSKYYEVVSSNMKWDEIEYDYKINKIMYCGNHKMEVDSKCHTKKKMLPTTQPYFTSKKY